MANGRNRRETRCAKKKVVASLIKQNSSATAKRESQFTSTLSTCFVAGLIRRPWHGEKVRKNITRCMTLESSQKKASSTTKPVFTFESRRRIFSDAFLSCFRLFSHNHNSSKAKFNSSASAGTYSLDHRSITFVRDVR